MRNIAFIEGRIASEVLDVEALAAGDVLLPAVDGEVVPEAVAVLEAVTELEEIDDIAVELIDVPVIEADDVAVPFELLLFPECE